MADRTIQKAKAGLEDILVGTSKVSQTRGSASVDITKINSSELMVQGIYDFDVNAGDIGDIVLAVLPDNAVITQAWYEVIEAFTSGGSATIALGVETDDATGIEAAVAFDDAKYTTGYHDADQDGTATNFTTKSTAIRNIILTIGTAAITAGKLYFWCNYIISE